jgi:3-oxo-5alpha-steroid 4-dehydrogenase
MAFINMHINRKTAVTLFELGEKCRMPAGALDASVMRYNTTCSIKKDEFGKSNQYLEGIKEPPFHAINCRLDSRLFLSPCLTLGGLRTGITSQTLRGNGSPIPGLYAAGRSAAGVCSRSYVSGLSLSDCIFSGRNAGRSATKARRRSRNHTKGKTTGEKTWICTR